jgi:hypothetical protein
MESTSHPSKYNKGNVEGMMAPQGLPPPPSCTGQEDLAHAPLDNLVVALDNLVADLDSLVEVGFGVGFEYLEGSLVAVVLDSLAVVLGSLVAVLDSLVEVGIEHLVEGSLAVVLGNLVVEGNLAEAEADNLGRQFEFEEAGSPKAVRRWQWR